MIEAVTNQTEKEALVAKEGAGFKFCKPCALHCPAPQKHGTGRAPLQPGGARSLGEANSGADFTFQSESMHVDTCAHPPVSGQASVATASSPPRPRPGPPRGLRAAQSHKEPMSVSLLDSGLRSSIDAGREAFGPGDYNALCFGRTSFWIFFWCF